MTKKIGIVGLGYVGTAMRNFFKDHFETYFIDPVLPNSNSKNEINTCDLAVVCVPTPMSANGEVDLSHVEEVLSWLNTPVILIKSTIPPTTTDSLKSKYGKRIVFSPEYIGEGKYVVQWWKDKNYPHPTDMKYHDFQIFGGERKDTNYVIEFFKKVLGPEVKYIQTDSKTAELVKYMENSWGATKVTFCNEFAKIAEVFGIDYNELRELWLLDGRVERMHTVVFEDNRGFGGKCYPKDVNGIVKQSENFGYKPELLTAVLEVNKKIRNEA